MKRCKVYLILIIKVRRDRLFPRALRVLEGTDSKIVYVDEEERRIVSNVPHSVIDRVIRQLIKEFAEYTSYEIKASCSLDDQESTQINRVLMEKLKFRVVAKGPSKVFLGIFRGRIFSVELKGRKLYVKIGTKTSAIPSLPIPPSLFVFENVEERVIKDSIEKLNTFINTLL